MVASRQMIINVGFDNDLMPNMLQDIFNSLWPGDAYMR